MKWANVWTTQHLWGFSEILMLHWKSWVEQHLRRFQLKHLSCFKALWIDEINFCAMWFASRGFLSKTPNHNTSSIHRAYRLTSLWLLSLSHFAWITGKLPDLSISTWTFQAVFFVAYRTAVNVRLNTSFNSSFASSKHTKKAQNLQNIRGKKRARATSTQTVLLFFIHHWASERFQTTINYWLTCVQSTQPPVEIFRLSTVYAPMFN